MKKYMLASMLLATTTFVSAQESKVPSTIKASFEKQYPKAIKPKWDKEKEGYEVNFVLEGTEHSVVYDQQGNIKETEVEIKVEQLPTAALAYAKANYARKAIKEAAKITDVKGTVTYEAEINGKDVLFDTNGKFLKEEKEGEE